MVVYPSVDKVIEFNALSLSVISIKKSDAAKVLSFSKVEAAIDSCRKAKGSVLDKAVVLLKGLVQAHAFASGNRRTAFVATQWRRILAGRTVDGPALRDMLLRYATTANVALRKRVVRLDDEVTKLDAEIARLDAELEALAFELYALTDEDAALVAGNRASGSGATRAWTGRASGLP